MVILNTTFFAEESLAQQVATWLAEVYARSAEESGIFAGKPEIARILSPTEPGAVSFACRCVCGSVEEAGRWHDSTASLLKDDVHARWGSRVVWFTTYMETL